MQPDTPDCYVLDGQFSTLYPGMPAARAAHCKATALAPPALAVALRLAAPGS